MQNKQNVASLELCKELNSLSKWHDITFFWQADDGWFVDTSRGNGLWLPAYDSGYLLRKLLPVTQIEFIQQSDGKMLLLYYPEPLEETSLFAKTPEDALCKLAIQLFKSGELTK